MSQNTLTLSVIAVLIISVGVGAKRGCSAFGHSCFGGHGKRSDSSLESSNGELMGRRHLGQEETPPHPVYPHPYGILPSGDDIIPIRDGGAYSSRLQQEDANIARDNMKMKLRNIIRYWVDSSRRSRRDRDDGYPYEAVN